jgi:peroxiredoxin
MANASAPSSAALPQGSHAPDFELPVSPDRKASLRDYAGAPLVLVFYPADWSPVCGDELTLFNELLPEFERHGARVVGISVDGPWCHRAYARDRKLRFPLLADFEPKGDVSRRYRAYRARDGFSERALFVVDADGKVFWSHVSPLDVNPGADGVLDALEELSGAQRRPDQQQRHQDLQPGPEITP